ncbi:MAG: ATP-binding cassette domain-containing protein [Betaproteobacteria bacterium]|nr:ATP-binding cassette domain-containing protein [Betaproteobacteria bacterium]
MLLHVSDLRAGYGSVPILQGVDLSLEAGTVVAILGPNGVGKTTLVRALAGLLQATGGRVEFDGHDITRASATVRARGGLGCVPQGREIFPKLTAMENLLVGAHACGLPRGRVDEVLEDFPGLRVHLKKLGGTLSGGEQQLLALARALVLRPKLLLLDEPSEGVQPSIIDQIQDVLTLARTRDRLAVLLVEQNLAFASALADRAHLMERGRLVRSIDSEVLTDDRTLYDAFVGTR